MVVSIRGKKYWLWRAVDALLQNRRNKRAALQLMRRLLKGQGTTPRVMVTDKLRSLGGEGRIDAGRRTSFA